MKLAAPVVKINPESCAKLDRSVLERLRCLAWRDEERFVPTDPVEKFANGVGAPIELLSLTSEDRWNLRLKLIEESLQRLADASAIHPHVREHDSGRQEIGYVVPPRKGSRAKSARLYYAGAKSPDGRLTIWDRRFLAALLVRWDAEPETAAAGAGRGGRTERNRFLAQSEG